MLTFSCPVQFYWTALFCSKYFGKYCLSDQTFGLYSTHSSSYFNLLTFCMLSKHLSNLEVKYKAGQWHQNSKFNEFL